MLNINPVKVEYIYKFRTKNPQNADRQHENKRNRRGLPPLPKGDPPPPYASGAD